MLIDGVDHPGDGGAGRGDAVEFVDGRERLGGDAVAHEPVAPVLGFDGLDEDVDAVVGVAAEVVDGGLDGGGEHQRGGDERRSEHDGEAGEGEAGLAAGHALEGGAQHGQAIPPRSWASFSKPRILSMTASAVGSCMSSTIWPSARKTTRSA